MELEMLKCSHCGGTLTKTSATRYTCKYCGNVFSVKQDIPETTVMEMNIASDHLRGLAFSRAKKAYEDIAAKGTDVAEVYWNLVLCKYGIQYVDDTRRTGRFIPTMHRMSSTPVTDDPNYLLALKYAEDKKEYEEKAKEIEAIRQRVFELSLKQPPYDVFICYKQADETGKPTEESLFAMSLFHTLEKKGYKVFFARESLKTNIGEDYEPHIYHALETAKVMLLMCFEEKYVNATWVENEWDRFADMKDKTLIPITDIYFNAYDLPDKIKGLQALSRGDADFSEKLLGKIQSAVGQRKEKGNKKEIELPEELKLFRCNKKANGKYEILGLTDEYVSEVVIPDSVEVIQKGAFKGNKYLRSVTFSDSVKIIENEAFADCPNLEIEIPDTVSYIGKNALRGTLTDQKAKQANQVAKQRKTSSGKKKNNQKNKNPGLTFKTVLLFFILISSTATIASVFVFLYPKSDFQLQLFKGLFIAGICIFPVCFVLRVSIFKKVFIRTKIKHIPNITLLVSLACMVVVLCCVGNMKINGVYTDSEYDVVYYEMDSGYTVGRNGGKQESVFIRSNIDGTPVNTVRNARNKYMKEVTFEEGGTYTLNARAFYHSFRLTTVNLDKVTINVKKRDVFKKCDGLKTVNVGTGRLTGVSAYFNTATLCVNGGEIELDCLGISKKSYLINGVNVGANGGTVKLEVPSIAVVDSVKIDKDIDLEKLTFKVTGGFAGIYPVALKIYLPSNIAYIPENFLGNKDSCTVYYGGTQEQWNALTIKDTGNENYGKTSGWLSSYEARVTVIYNYDAED